MENDRQSITFKVVIGYLLFAALAAVAVWFVYSQVRSYTEMAEAGISSNKKLYLVGDAATNLYEAESLSRQLIQSGSPKDLELYDEQIEDIQLTLNSLKDTYTDSFLKTEIDSINSLLSQKSANLKELVELRQEAGNQSYYSKVLAEIQRMNGNFGEPDYDNKFPNLEPHQRRLVAKILEFSTTDSPATVTTETLDSLVTSVKNVLLDFEAADRRYRQTLRNKENQLLANEVEINSQLRNLLSAIEKEEREASMAQVAESQEMVRDTSRTIAILGAVSFLVIFVFLFLVVRDVTRSQQYRKQLEDAKQYAESLLKSREQFMATVTHDLRSPLNTVEGYTDLLQNTQLNHTQNHYLKQLQKSTSYILRLVNDLLDLAKLEAGKMTVEMLPFNAKNLIEDTVEGAIPAQKSENVKVKVQVDEALNRNVKSDPFRIKQILINLVTNACKFTNEGNVTITANLNNQSLNSQLVISVKDTGIGISEAKREAIFEEFSQEDSSIEKRFGGSGLGLAITKKLTELLQGKIELHSETGKGSEFVVHIPVEKADNAPTPVQKEEPKLSEKAGNYKVLVVDDEPAQLGLISEFIKSTGLSLETSNNGEEALQKLKTGNFDIVLTDIQMPKMDGMELLATIKKNPKTANLPVVALSGKADIAPKDYLEKGFKGSLLKPYSSTKLLHIIEEALEVDLIKIESSENGNERTSENYSLEEVRLFAGGDKVALKTIILTFIRSTMNNLNTLQEAFDEGKKENIPEIAHKMLPMFRQLKADTIVKQLDYLETTDVSQIGREHLQVLRKEVTALTEELESEVKD